MTFDARKTGRAPRVPASPARIVTALAAAVLAMGCGNLDDHLGSQNVGYRPDGTLVVYTAQDLRLFDGQLRQMLGPPTAVQEPGQSQVPNTFALSDDGATAAVSYTTEGAVTTRNAVKVWRLPSAELVGDIDIDAQPKPPITRTSNVGLVALRPAGDLFFAQNRAMAPDGPTIRSSDSGVFRVSDGVRLWGGYWLTSPVFSADGETLYATTRLDSVGRPDAFELAAFDAVTGNLKFAVDASPFPTDIDLVAGGTQIAGIWTEGDGGDPTNSASTLSIAFWSALDGSLIRVVQAIAPGSLYGTAEEGAPAFTCWHRGDLCAAGTTNGIAIWNVDGTLVRSLPRISTPLSRFGSGNDLAFSPDGKLLAVAGDATRVFRVADGALVSEQRFPSGLF